MFLSEVEGVPYDNKMFSEALRYIVRELIHLIVGINLISCIVALNILNPTTVGYLLFQFWP